MRGVEDAIVGGGYNGFIFKTKTYELLREQLHSVVWRYSSLQLNDTNSESK